MLELLRRLIRGPQESENHIKRFPLSEILGKLEVPGDYPAGLHIQIDQLARTTFQANAVPETIQSQFRMAMNSIAYRYKSFVESSNEFSDLVSRWGAAPTQPQRYAQERAFFEFVMTGNACLEAIAYALFALGSALHPDRFPFEDDQHRKHVNLRSTADAYREDARHIEIADSLTSVAEADQFQVMSTLRRVLYHRGLPGRLIIAGSGKPSRYHDFADIEGIDVQPHSLTDLASWVRKALQEIFTVTSQMMQQQASESDQAAA